jgi:hypothetical protein
MSQLTDLDLQMQECTAFSKKLTIGAWSAIEISTGRVDPATCTLESWWKTRIHHSVQGVLTVASAGTQTDACDKSWDRVQRRADARSRYDLDSEDPEVSAAAARFRKAFLSGDGTAQTGLARDREVTYGRHQVELAKQPAHAADIAKLGYQPLIEEIDGSTEALARALGLDTPDRAGSTAPSDRKRNAVRGCITTCRAVLADLDAALGQPEIADAVRRRLESLRAPLAELIERVSVRAETAASQGDGDAANDNEGEAPTENAAPAVRKVG